MQITLNFKSNRQEMEWEGGKLNAKLIGIVLWAAWWWAKQGRQITLTHIFRTHKEQMALYGDNTETTSLHELWRAVDMSVQNLSEPLLVDFLQVANKIFPYDIRRPNLKTFLRHDMGEGDHIHIQVME